MSLVRSAEPSTASYRTPKLYSVKENGNNGVLPSQIFSPDKPNNTFLSDSFSDESYEKYFLESPTEELMYPSGSGVSISSCDHQDSYFNQPRHGLGSSMEIQVPFGSSFLSTRQFDGYEENFQQGVEFDEAKMRLKLRELERALLDDDNDGTLLERDDHIMEIDNEWSDPIEKEMLHDSPKESSSADSNSNLSSNSMSNKNVKFQSSIHTPKQMLILCANALSEGKSEEALSMINELRNIVSIQGNPSQRIAAYMVEGLAARMAASGKFLYKALRCKEPPSDDRLAAMQILFEVCPCFKLGFLAANSMIIEALEGEKRVHIIDFDINQGNQYIALIQTIAKLPGKRPHLKLTGVDDPESIQRPIGGLQVIGLRLEQLAEDLGVLLEFRAVPSKTSMVTPSMLGYKPGESLIVNFAFQLHHMPDESVSTVNQRDQLLRMVKSLNPKLVTIVEQDVNTNTSPFFPRFIEAYEYYAVVFESLDATLPRESQDRMNVERQCLARDIVNIVACEGDERIERYEVAGKWRARMTMAGFAPNPMSSKTVKTVQNLIKQNYCDRYKMEEETGELHFGWEEKSLIVASAWRC